MGYKVVGKLKHDDEEWGHGDSVSASDVGGKENFKTLVDGRSVITDDEFDELYPEQKDGEVVDPSGMPSNLREVEGTKLQANMPEDKGDKSDSDDSSKSPPNPANPPEVKGAGDAKAAAKDKGK